MTRTPQKTSSQLNPEAIINRQILREAGVFAVSLCGAPGCGRSTIVNATAHLLEDVARTAVIVAGKARGRKKYCANHVVHVEATRLDAAQVRKAIDQLPLADIDLLMIEAAGSVEVDEGDLGEHVRVALFSVAGGDDKAAEARQLVREASLVLLSKIDLLPRVEFNIDAFAADVAKANPTAPILQISVPKRLCLEAWVQWLNEQRLRKSRPKDGGTDDWFMGLKLIDTAACTCLKSAKPPSGEKVAR